MEHSKKVRTMEHPENTFWTMEHPKNTLEPWNTKKVLLDQRNTLKIHVFLILALMVASWFTFVSGERLFVSKDFIFSKLRATSNMLVIFFGGIGLSFGHS